MTHLQRRHRLNAVLAVFALGPALFTPTAAADVPPDVVFDVYRNGSAFGEHAVRFRQAPDGRLDVAIDIELRVGFGPVTVFRYEHQSEEIWADGELIALEAETFKDGERLRFALQRDAQGVLRSDSQAVADLIPSSHWSGYIPGLPAVLNTETGEAMPVSIEDLGPDRVQTASGEIEARRYRMSGTVTVDLWYDADGRWVGCAFSIRGQDIVYRLRDA